MSNELTRQRRAEIGRRVRTARETLPVYLRKLQNFSRELGVSESMASQMETGSRPIPAEVLPLISKLTGVDVLHLLGETGESPVANETSYAPAIQFLQQAEQLGLLGIHPDRDAALYDLIPFIQKMYAGSICITSSSSKGLQQDSNHDFVRTVVETCESRPQVVVKMLFTHPTHGYMRELLEGRTRGSIVTEIFQGIRWAIERLYVASGNIRLIKASPALFTVFATDGKDGVGLLNAYPHMRQAFTSFAFTVRSLPAVVAPTSSPAARSKSIYHGIYLSNFQAPWESNNEEITVDLERSLAECKDSKDELLIREATALESFQKDAEQRRSQAKEAVNPEASVEKTVSRRTRTPKS